MRAMVIGTMVLTLALAETGALYAQGLDTYLERAEDRFRKADYYAALDVADEALDWFPERAETHSMMGRVLFKIARFEEARVHFEEAMRIDSANFWAHHGMGLYFLARGNPDEARGEFAAAHSLWADNELPCLMLARAAEESDRYEDAEGWIAQALEIIRARGEIAPRILEMERDRLAFLSARQVYWVSPAFDRTTVTMEGDRPVVRVLLGPGAEGVFLLDTAAPHAVMVHPEVAFRAAGQHVSTLGEGRSGSAGTDDLILLDRVEIGALRVEGVPCLVSGRMEWADVDGVIGLPFLRRFAWTFDFRSREVTIWDPQRDTGWAYEHRPGEAVERLYPGGPLLVPILLDDQRPAVVVLDSASDAFSLDHRFFERELEGLIPAGAITDVRTVESPHGITPLVAFRLAKITIGDFADVRGLDARTFDVDPARRWAGVAAPGVLGLSLLADWMVDLNFPDRRLTLWKPS